MSGRAEAGWPHALPACDPFADLEAVDLRLALALHGPRRGLEAMDGADHDRTVRAFLAALDGLLARTEDAGDPCGTPGEVDARVATVRELARVLGIWSPAHRDPRRPPRAPHVADRRAMARVASDIAPALGNDAPDRFLGPWAAQLDPRRACEALALSTALAASCFLPIEHDPNGYSPLVHWSRRRPLPSIEEREAFRAVGRAPWSAWALRARRGDAWVLEDRIGLSPHAIPDAPVRIPEIASVQGAGDVGDTLLARVVPTTGGWVAAIAFAVRGEPPARALRSRVHLELLRMRLTHPCPSVDDVLRERGHLVVRQAHEWAWLESAR